MRSRALVEASFASTLATLTRLRAGRVISRVPMPVLHAAARGLAAAMLRARPVLRGDAEAVLARAFPAATTRELERLAREHYASMTFSTLLLSGMPDMSDARIAELFDTHELDRVVRAARTGMVVLAGAHFFPHPLVCVIADRLHREGISLCATMEIEAEPKLQPFFDRLKRRYHWDDHVPIDVAAPRRDLARRLQSYLDRERGVVFVFGDYRFRRGTRDRAYRIGEATYYANDGVRKVLLGARNPVAFMPVRLSYERESFALRLSELPPDEQGLGEYYLGFLPRLIERLRGQWSLWFMADRLSDLDAESGARAVTDTTNEAKGLGRHG